MVSEPSPTMVSLPSGAAWATPVWWPPPPSKRWFPAPREAVSVPPRPNTTSLPAPAAITSSPLVPMIVFGPLVPVIVTASPLQVAATGPRTGVVAEALAGAANSTLAHVAAITAPLASFALPSAGFRIGHGMSPLGIALVAGVNDRDVGAHA